MTKSTKLADARPFFDQQFGIGPFRRRREEIIQMHAVIRETRDPGLLHGEAEDGREPSDDAAEDFVRYRAGGSAARGLRGIAIERVLADVEIEGRQVVGAEIEQRGVHQAEIVILVGLAHGRIELGQPVPA